MKNCKYLPLVVLMACLLSKTTEAQQVEQYSNYLFNQYGINPAVGGSTKCFETRFGHRRQWGAFEGAPLTYTFSVHKAIDKDKTFRRGWHGVGVMAVNDEAGPYGLRAIYPSYSYHVRMRKELVLSLGIFVGVRQEVFQRNQLRFSDSGDPLLMDGGNFLLYPDISPGIWLHSRNFFTGLSVRQVYKNKLKQKNSQIGSPSSLRPHFYYTLGKRFKAKAYYYSYIPSVHVRFTPLLPPSVDLNFMMFIKDQVGFGAGIRYPDAVIALFQWKFKKQFQLSYSYDITTSRVRTIGSNTHELVLGFTVCKGKDYSKKLETCPAYN